MTGDPQLETPQARAQRMENNCTNAANSLGNMESALSTLAESATSLSRLADRLCHDGPNGNLSALERGYLELAHSRYTKMKGQLQGLLSYLVDKETVETVEVERRIQDMLGGE